MIEHPDITRALLTGYPHGEPRYPECPVCGAECDHIYRHADGDMVGCEECITMENAWEIEY